jgi:hypothetical protein
MEGVAEAVEHLSVNAPQPTAKVGRQPEQLYQKSKFVSVKIYFQNSLGMVLSCGENLTTLKIKAARASRLSGRGSCCLNPDLKSTQFNV